MAITCPKCGGTLSHRKILNPITGRIELEYYQCESCAASLPCRKGRREEKRREKQNETIDTNTVS